MDSSQVVATKAMCVYCFDGLLYFLEKKEILAAPVTFPKTDAPLFVSWHTSDGKLRGCIGTFAKEPLTANLEKYTLQSALKDSRFSPILKKEVKDLNCSLSLLTHFEPGKKALDWEVGVHGIRIEFEDKDGKSYHATYLPHVAKEQGWNQEEALKHLIKKAGYNGALKDVIHKIVVERYQSSKTDLDYKDYLLMKSTQEDKSSDK